MNDDLPLPDPGQQLSILRAGALQRYSELEQSMCALFAELTGLDRRTAGLIFFKITTSRTRLTIIETLLKWRFESLYNLFRNSLVKHIGYLDLRRNGIVHWLAVAEYNGLEKVKIGVTPPTSAYLTPPAFWWESTETLSIEDIRYFNDYCKCISSAIGIFKIFAVDPPVHGIPAQIRDSWLEIFSEPLLYPLPEDHLLYSPPSGPRTPPPPSGG